MNPLHNRKEKTKTCEYCKLNFKTKYPTEKYCSDLCMSYERNRQCNQGWINRKPRGPVSKHVRNMVEQSYLYQRQPHFFKKFQAVRG